MLRQRPLFTVIAATSVAIGIGATTVIATVLNTLLLQAPAGVRSPERAVEIGRSVGGRGFDTFSFPELLDMREQARTLEHIAGWRFTPLSFSTGQESERIMGLAASAQYFPALGLTPALGRFYSTAEDRTPGASALVVPGHHFRQNRFNADRNILGRTIDINRRQFTIIGCAGSDPRAGGPFRSTLATSSISKRWAKSAWLISRPARMHSARPT